MRPTLLVACCCLVLGHAVRAPAESADLGFLVPDGFSVTRFADDALAHDIYSMTIDSQGRIVVAGPGYVKILHDDDQDGVADRATLYSALPQSGAQGLLFLGNDLICTGDDALLHLTDANGDGVADGPPESWAQLRHSEHGAHGLVHGPDGWLYLICGNDAGILPAHEHDPASPVRDPRCGGILRISADGRNSEILAHGMRNPYDLDFNDQGHLFTVDADGERDHLLPWYAPTRLFDVALGMEHGWLLQGWQRSWNRPAYFPDNVPRLVEIGRGSPTGLVVYRHRQFPPAYRQGVFTACWTLGRIYHVALAPDQASYTARLETFLRTTGDVGFAPVDLAVGVAGDLFVAVGGRGTRGSVFRVHYDPSPELDPPQNKLRQVLDADQPLASWSRAAWVPIARELGATAFADAVLDATLPTTSRIRAVEVLTELFEGIPLEVAAEAIAEQDYDLIARIAWAMSRHPLDVIGRQLLVELTYHPAESVQRAAWESLAMLPEIKPDELVRAPNWQGALDNASRRVRSAMLVVARDKGSASFQQSLGEFRGNLPLPRLLGYLWVLGTSGDGRPDWLVDYVRACLRAFSTSHRPAERLEALRLLQLALGDLHLAPDQAEVYSGYTADGIERLSPDLHADLSAALADGFPTGDTNVDQELARLFSILSTAQADLPERLAAHWTSDSSTQDDLHYLIVLSRLPSPRSTDVTRATASALAGLHHKLASARRIPDRNWPLRAQEVCQQLLARDPQLAAALVDDEHFSLPAQSILALHLPEDLRQRAARKLLACVRDAGRAASDEDSPGSAWTTDMVSLVASLPAEESLPELRAQWDDSALRDAITLALVRRPENDDRSRLVQALDSCQPEVVLQAARALLKLDGRASPEETVAALRVLRSYTADPAQRVARQSLQRLLQHWTGQPIQVEESGMQVAQDYQPWFRWFAQAYPEQSQLLNSTSVADLPAWLARLRTIDWSRSDAGRGEAIFRKRACHGCHATSNRLGPALTNAASRFSREDLFVAILDPNRDVSPLHQTTSVVTRSGHVYHGLLVYDSADGVLLQTTADTTVRIAGDDLQSVVPSRMSLMPVGLLRDASDQDLADLDAYLRSLKPE